MSDHTANLEGVLQRCNLCKSWYRCGEERLTNIILSQVPTVRFKCGNMYKGLSTQFSNNGSINISKKTQ